MNDIAQLPHAAQALVAQIEALLDQAEPLLALPAAPVDAVYGVKATRTDYLPQTIAGYTALPPARRTVVQENGKSAEALLLEQLSVLLRATQQHLDLLSAHQRGAQEAQGRFLRERFDDRSEAIETVDGGAVPAAAAKRFVANLIGDASQPARLVAGVAARMRELIPQFTQVQNGGLFGTGPVEAVHVTVPVAGGDGFRFSLSARGGVVSASCTRIVRNVPIKSVVVPLDQWIESLYEEIVAYARHHADVQRSLERFS